VQKVKAENACFTKKVQPENNGFVKKIQAEKPVTPGM